LNRRRGKKILTVREIHYMQLFETLTGLQPDHCIVDDEFNRVIFIVKFPSYENLAPEQVYRRIDRAVKGVTRILEREIGRTITVIPYSDKLEEFVQHLFRPAHVLSVRLIEYGSNRKTLLVTVPYEERSLAIGRSGHRVKLAECVLHLYYGIDRVRVIS